MSLKNNTLDQLVANKQLTSYTYRRLDKNRQPVDTTKGDSMREEVVLVFPNGQMMVMESWCSNSWENCGMEMTMVEQIDPTKMETNKEEKKSIKKKEKK